MTRLEKIKSLIFLKKLNEVIALPNLVKYLEEVSSNLGVSLDKTTPKGLYGKSYSELTKEELAEYTQIKRLLKRAK